MNTYFGPPTPPFGERPGDIAHVLHKDDGRIRLLTLPGNKDFGVAFRTGYGDYIPLARNEAIEAAELILRHYRVPFCNRVAGAGTIEKGS